MVEVYEWQLSDGTGLGCGTRVEFDHWKAEGTLPEDAVLGPVLTHEPASEDERRKEAWAA